MGSGVWMEPTHGPGILERLARVPDPADRPYPRIRRRGTSCRSAWQPSPLSTPGLPPNRAQPAPAPGTRPVPPDSAGTDGNKIHSGHRRPEPASRRLSTTGATGKPTSGSPAGATSVGLILCSNNSAACTRTDSRHRRPAAVNPPPSPYLTHHGIQPPLRGLQEIHRSSP